MLSYGIHRYLFVERNPMGSMGIQRSPFMSIGITGLLVNLTSDKCSIRKICLVLKALKQLVSRANDLNIHRVFRAFKQNSALRQQMQYA